MQLFRLIYSVTKSRAASNRCHLCNMCRKKTVAKHVKTPQSEDSYFSRYPLQLDNGGKNHVVWEVLHRLPVHLRFCKLEKGRFLCLERDCQKKHWQVAVGQNLSCLTFLRSGNETKDIGETEIDPNAVLLQHRIERETWLDHRSIQNLETMG